MNEFKTFLLIAVLVALFMAVGFAAGGQSGMLIAFIIAAALNLYTYWNSDKVILKMHGAQSVGPEHRLTQIVAPLAERAAIPMPKVYVVDQPQPNAFATGRNPRIAAVAATSGLLESLSQGEIEAVMAHEIAHIKNRDTLLMTITATLAGGISMLGNYALFFGQGRNGGRQNAASLLLLFIAAPFAASVVRMAISRNREYKADARGADISGDPLGLASALINLEAAARSIRNPIAEANPAAATLYIVSPLVGGFRDNLFSTHPSLANRTAALEQIATSVQPAGTQ